MGLILISPSQDYQNLQGCGVQCNAPLVSQASGERQNGSKGGHAAPSVASSKPCCLTHLLQCPPAGCLASHGGAHQHEAMPDQRGLVQLNALVNESWHGLHIEFLAGITQRAQQVLVIDLQAHRDAQCDS